MPEAIMSNKRLQRRALLLAALAAFVAGCRVEPLSFKAADITGSEFGGDFELPDHMGKTRRLADFRGKVVIVFFGFTNCPDVCPTTLSTLAEVAKRLGPEADALQVLMITVDPARDSRELMSRYVPAFDPSFIGLIPSESQLKQVTERFKVIYVRNKPDVAGFYSVDHTAAAFVFDRENRVRLYVPHEMSIDDRVEDLRKLLAGR